MSQKSLVARSMAQDPEVHSVFQEMVATLVREAGMNNEQAESQAFVQVMDAFRN
ncbi:hypothetical protein WG622_07440 [Cognatishimia sp. D5M38]|uniref:Uncharacterized protein n=1 Tax=Cognatishimia coralii TaxID=3083254 RepID=A0ABU8QF64_9RHOB